MTSKPTITPCIPSGLQIMNLCFYPRRNCSSQVSLDPRMDQTLTACLSLILVHVCHAAHGKAPHSSAQSGPLETNNLSAGGSRGYRDSGLLRAGLGCLLVLIGLLPPPRWAATWSEVSRSCPVGSVTVACSQPRIMPRLPSATSTQNHASQLHAHTHPEQVSGTFWLSRLTRDGDAVIRTQALSLLARLASPSAGPAHRMLEALWPEAPATAARLALGGGGSRGPPGFGGDSVGGAGLLTMSSSECLAGRAAALRFLTCVMGMPEDEQLQVGGVGMNHPFVNGFSH